MGVWGWMKNVASKAWDTTKKVGRAIGTGVQKVGRAVRPVVNVAQKVAGFAERIPGFIGEGAKWAKAGLDKINDWIGLIPESGVKDKLKEASSSAGDLIDQGEEWALNKADQAQGYVNQAKPWIDFADNITRSSGPTSKSGGVTSTTVMKPTLANTVEQKYRMKYGRAFRNDEDDGDRRLKEARTRRNALPGTSGEDRNGINARKAQYRMERDRNLMR